MKLIKNLPNWTSSWEFLADVEYYSKQFEIDKDILIAIIQVESCGNANATRYENFYKWIYDLDGVTEKHNKAGLFITKETVNILQKTSFGIMQAMGSLFYQYRLHVETNYKLLPVNMINPRLSLEVGCRHLKNLITSQRLSNPLDIYAAYNAGSVRLLNGKYSNQSNVDNFNKAYSDIQKLN
jgi:soluble lytic murein transglycosylase-like protein